MAAKCKQQQRFNMLGSFGKALDSLVAKILKISKTVNDSPSKVPYPIYMRWVKNFHFVFGICALLFMVSQSQIKDAIGKKSGQLTAAYLMFEFLNWAMLKIYLGKVEHFPANYITLVFIRCFLFYNVDAGTPDPKSFLTLHTGSWTSLEALAVVIPFLVSIPTIVLFTKANVTKCDVFCLLGTITSSSLSLVVLLTSMLIPPETKEIKTKYGTVFAVIFSFLEKDEPNKPDESFEKVAHFYVCVIWLYISSIMTFLDTLIIFQRMYNYSKKKIDPEEFGRSIQEIFVMLIAFGLTFPYIRHLHPNLGFDQVFPALRPNSSCKHFLDWLGQFVFLRLFAGLSHIYEMWKVLAMFVTMSYESSIYETTFQPFFKYVDENWSTLIWSRN